MTREIDLPRLYRGQINLWVEDPLTADYLRELWIGAPVQFLISGGNEGVFSLVKEAQLSAFTGGCCVLFVAARGGTPSGLSGPRSASSAGPSTAISPSGFVVQRGRSPLHCSTLVLCQRA